MSTCYTTVFQSQKRLKLPSYNSSSSSSSSGDRDQQQQEAMDTSSSTNSKRDKRKKQREAKALDREKRTVQITMPSTDLRLAPKLPGYSQLTLQWALLILLKSTTRFPETRRAISAS